MSGDGPHRSAAPETTLARLRPLLPALGITRIAVLTGLDVVGIPVAAAYRPNSRSIAVHQGKGRTLVAAKASAVMEAVECFCGESFDGPLRYRTCSLSAPWGGEGWGEVGVAPRTPVAVESLATAFPLGHPPHPDPLPPQERAERGKILCTEAENLATGTTMLVPFELVSADFSVPAPPGFGLFQQTTNGLGAGNTLLEATLQGLYEVVERDAVARWHGLSPDQQAACAVDPETVEGPGRWFLGRLTEAGANVRLWDITAESGIPAFMALAWDSDGIAGIEPESGAGCHASADVALARALAEAAQARLTRISGARDDFAPASYAPAARTERQAAAECLARAKPVRQFRAVAAATTPETDLENALARLPGPILRVDLTRPEIGIPVARIVAPGLRAPVEEA